MPSEDRNVWMELSLEERQMVYTRFAERAQRLNIRMLDPGLRDWA